MDMPADFAIRSTVPTALAIHGSNGNILVSISMNDGTLTFGPNYTPDAAARAFWEAISSDYRRMLRWKTEHPDAR